MKGILAWLLVLALAAGCAPAGETLPTVTGAAPIEVTVAPPATLPPTPAADVVQPEAASEAMLIFEREGGLVGVSEAWTIYADGRIESGQGQSLTVPAAEASQTLAAIEALGFFELDEAYGRGSQCADCFTYTITLVKDGRRHTVSTVDSAPDAPPALAQIIAAINGLIASA